MFNTGFDLDLFQGFLYPLTNINSHGKFMITIFENQFIALQSSVPFDKLIFKNRFKNGSLRNSLGS